MVNYNESLLTLFTRDLNRLKDELNLYASESNIWKVEPNIANSAGNLTLHLIGNLNHFIGATLGHSGYVRVRELEFSQKDIARSVLIEKIDDTIIVLNEVLSKMSNTDMETEYAFMKPDKMDSAGHFLIHLFGHLAYHLGQINYHRRLLDK